MQPRFGDAFAGEEHQPFTLQGSSTAALLIHGFPGTPDEMRPVAHLLHEQTGMTIRAALLPGFGIEIDTINERSYADWLAAMRAELFDLRREHERVLLVGYSMGGAISLKLASEHAVDGLILFSPFVEVQHILWHALPAIRLVLPRIKIFRLFKPDFDDPQTREGILTFMPDADLDDPTVREQIMNFEMPIKMFNQIRVAGVKGRNAAPQITAPALVIQGTEDDLAQPANTRQLITRFRSAIWYEEVTAPHAIIDPELADWPKIEAAISAFIKDVMGVEYA